jgi:hypothetical protein
LDIDTSPEKDEQAMRKPIYRIGFSSSNLLQSNLFLPALTILLIPVFIWISIVTVKNIFLTNGDFIHMWLGSYLVRTGGNLYSNEIWVNGLIKFGIPTNPPPTYAYPLPLAILMAPIGWLSLESAFTVWVFLSLVMIFLSLSLLVSMKDFPKNGWILFPILISVLAYHPTVLTLYVGQFGVVFLIILSAVIVLWEKEKWGAGGFLLAFTTLKPNLGAPIIAILLLWLISRRKWLPILFTILGGGLIVLIGLLKDIHWVEQFLSVGKNFFSAYLGLSSTVWGISGYLCNFNRSCIIPLGSLISLPIIVGVIYLVHNKRNVLSPSFIVSIAICTTLLVTPYTWAYNHILLIIPIVVIISEMVKAGYPFLITTALFPFIDLLAFFLLIFRVRSDYEIIFVLVPMFMMTLLTWIITHPYLGKNPAIINR